jgi:hypothetical protein
MKCSWKIIKILIKATHFLSKKIKDLANNNNQNNRVAKIKNKKCNKNLNNHINSKIKKTMKRCNFDSIEI